MTLRLEGYIELPIHLGSGGFDHAAIHDERRRLYIAHTANDALDVVDLDVDAYLESIGGLPGVAGALVAESGDVVFSTNRAEDTIAIFEAAHPERLTKVAVGRRPNGLAFDPNRRMLLVANLGDEADPASHTVTVIKAGPWRQTASILVPGRTRWAVYDASRDAFLVNIANPPAIVVVAAADPTRVVRTIDIPATGPHGLDVDEDGRLYCACDDGRLLILEPPSYAIVGDVPLAGAPDVIFLDEGQGCLYVAIGDPGLVQVVDIDARSVDETVPTEAGAHTLALDQSRHRVIVFLPISHRAAVFEDVA